MATVAHPRKCANAACTCTTEGKSKFCSAHCEGINEKVELMCTCGHAHCGTTVSVFPSVEPDQPSPGIAR